MFSLFTTNLRRLVTVFLISMALFLGMAFDLSTISPAIADTITRDLTNASPDVSISNAEYEDAKVSRQQKQALRSEQAEARAELNNDNETIGEKLNLDEALPSSTKKFIEQIKGD